MSNQNSIPVVDTRLTLAGAARALNVPPMLLAKAVASRAVIPDSRVGDFTLFRRDQLPEIAEALVGVAKREPTRRALQEKLAEFRALGGAEATLFYQKNREPLRLAASLEARDAAAENP